MFQLRWICNTDQTPIWFEMPQNYTLQPRGERGPVQTSTGGKEKQRFTVQLTCSASGAKLPILVIFKASGYHWLPPHARPGHEPRTRTVRVKPGMVWHEIKERLPDDLGNTYPPRGRAVIITSPTATSNEICVKHFLHTIWQYRKGASADQPRSILVWDSFTAHQTDSLPVILERMRTIPHKIEGGLTPVLQPLDAVINKVSTAPTPV